MYELFQTSREHLDWMGRLFRAAANEVDAKVISRKYGGAERKRLRVMLARCLAVVFETAYGLEAIPKTNGQNNKPETFGVWADFFCRILRAAKDAAPTSNLGDVLKVARHLQINEPVLFKPGFMPD
jgi:hypothetical protein